MRKSSLKLLLIAAAFLMLNACKKCGPPEAPAIPEWVSNLVYFGSQNQKFDFTDSLTADTLSLNFRYESHNSVYYEFYPNLSFLSTCEYIYGPSSRRTEIWIKSDNTSQIHSPIWVKINFYTSSRVATSGTINVYEENVGAFAGSTFELNQQAFSNPAYSLLTGPTQLVVSTPNVALLADTTTLDSLYVRYSFVFAQGQSLTALNRYENDSLVLALRR